jgi:hypothetical protein
VTRLGILVAASLGLASTFAPAPLAAQDAAGVPGQEFKVEVDDCGEPGSDDTSPDVFSIQKLPAGYMAAGPLEGGNVQIH